MAQRSVVDQVVGNVKTEASKRPIPIDPYIAEDLLSWYRTTKYSRPRDNVFATDPPRAGKKRGQQPVWLSKVMSSHPTGGQAARYHQACRLVHVPTDLHDFAARQRRGREGRAGATASWLARITMDVYAQAVTPAKRKAQGKVVAMLRDTEKKTS
jgi:hypothetical protein